VFRRVTFLICSQRWCRRRGYKGYKRTLKSFDLLKIWEKSLKTWAKSLKIQTNLQISRQNPENLGKYGAQRCFASNVAPNVFRKTSKDHILEVTPKKGRQNLHNCLGKFGKIWAIILWKRKNSLAPTPMVLNSVWKMNSRDKANPRQTQQPRRIVMLLAWSQSFDQETNDVMGGRAYQ